jgi:phosphoheptose isomerase
MAKRKRYGSASKAHRARAGSAARSLRVAVKEYNAALKQGNCRLAYSRLLFANRLLGRFRAERQGVSAKAISGVAGRRLLGMESTFKRACVRDWSE